MKQFNQNKLEVAIKYVERIADGCNPVNNISLENDSVLNNPNIIRCMYFIKEVLEEVKSNDGVVRSTNRKMATVPFPKEILEEFVYKEDKSITHVLNQLYEPVIGMNIKKISAAKVTAILKDEGYLSEEKNLATGKLRKVPSDKGNELGIYLVDREFNGQVYQSVTYNKSAQEYVLDLIRKMLEQ